MSLPEHFFIASDGALCRDKSVTWAQGIGHAVREDYARHHRNIQTGLQLRSTLRAGAYAWPGGYPLYFITADGYTLSFRAVRENLGNVLYSIRHRLDNGWRVIACAINYEDQGLYCADTGKRIPTAYEN